MSFLFVIAVMEPEVRIISNTINEKPHKLKSAGFFVVEPIVGLEPTTC